MNSSAKQFAPQLIAWEITRRCHLKCRHCRAAALDLEYPDELTTEEIKKTLRNIATFSKPIIILTGGEPMFREDLYNIASYGTSLGFRMVMAPCGRFVTPESILKMKAAGIMRLSLSMDGSSANAHDNFRGLDGSFDDVMNAAKVARDGGMPFQINTTVTKENAKELEDILKLAVELGAVSFHPFLLVPTGRGKELLGKELDPEEYEQILSKIAKMSQKFAIHVKPTCAPHYFRISRQSSVSSKSSHHGMDSLSRGCLGGTGFAFISHVGKIQICGFLDVECGDLKAANYDFKKIWDTSDIFLKMRDKTFYRGKCGICEYHNVCGGCRARAYASTGEYMNPEPYCVYVPKISAREKQGSCVGDGLILTKIQDEFPIEHEPFLSLAVKLGLEEDELLDKILKWKGDGLVRHLSANANTSALGFESALVAMTVAESQIEKAALEIASHPGVSHSYLRDHSFNVWFTIKVPAGFDLEKHVHRISKLAGTTKYLILPSIVTYKLNVKFDATNLKAVCGTYIPRKSNLKQATPMEESIVEALNNGLKIIKHPFVDLAIRLGIGENELLMNIRSLIEKGAIEKIRFVLNHGKLGMKANAMVVWDIEDGKKDAIGKLFAQKEFISHCYERKRFKEFPYNLYTMIHANNQETLNSLTDSLAKDIPHLAFCKLKTLKELTKQKTTLSRIEYEKWAVKEPVATTPSLP